MFKAIFFFFSWLYFWTVLNGIIFYGVESNKSCVVCQIYSILSGGVLLVILFVLFSSKQVSDWRNIFALRKTSPLKVILFSFFSVLYVITVYLLFHQNGGLSPSRNDGYHLASILLVTLVLAPIFEELMFRGVLYSYISNGLFKDIGAITATSIIFIFMHSSNEMGFLIYVMLPITVLFGLARYITGSVITPIVMHAAVNFSMYFIKYFI
ncbi:MAG: CPBP family intramembrane metalloprotease [Gammaproteobacteria bacterium]|nr:CPBP family intramembrane metalloprotease [Gammaproteobacteria bacterium]